LLNEKYSPNDVANATGVDVPKLEKLARALAKASRPVAICGNGSAQDPVSSLDAMAVLSLNALVGSINRSGGIRLAAAPDYISWPVPELDAVAEKALDTPRLDGAGTAEYRDASSLPHRLIQKVNSKAQSPVQALFVCDANPVFTLRDSQNVKTAFEKIPLVVSLSAYMDDTAAQADYILPLHSYLERYEDFPTTAGLAKPMVGLARPVIKPVFDTKHPGDVLIALANAMGGAVAGAFPWGNYEDCLKETLADNWGTISSKGYLAQSALAAAAEAMAPAGQMDFSALVKLAEAKPRVHELTLIPYDCMRISGGPIGTPPFVIKTVADTVLKKTDAFIEINEVTAKKLKVKDGQTVMLETPVGKARVKINQTEGIANDVVAMPRGLGHAAFDDYLADKGVNINTLVAPVEDPVSGFDVAWGIKAQLTKA
jgi:anaerobic selenocysteine-containing dehydrogenase